jgi:hypothetical protein
MLRFPIRNKKNGDEIGTVYSYKSDKGIRWVSLSVNVNNKLTIFGIKATITPKVLLDKDYITVATEKDIFNLKSAFNHEANKISPILQDFDSYSLNRSDYCINFDLNELEIPCTTEQMMTLIKKGNIPTHFTERTKYDLTSRRQKPEKDSFYLVSDSVVINYYDKYAQLMKEDNHPCQNKEDANNKIRCEVQCSYQKLHSVSKHHVKLSNTLAPTPSAHKDIEDMYEAIISRRYVAIKIEPLLSDDVSLDVVQKYFNKVVRKGDYYTLERAKRIIQSTDYRLKTKVRLIDTLTLINQCRGIYKAKPTLQWEALVNFNRSIKGLENLGINPVTIPREWNIEHIPNLFNAYRNKLDLERSEELHQWSTRELVDAYFKKSKKGKKRK